MSTPNYKVQYQSEIKYEGTSIHIIMDTGVRINLDIPDSDALPIYQKQGPVIGKLLDYYNGKTILPQESFPLPNNTFMNIFLPDNVLVITNSYITVTLPMCEELVNALMYADNHLKNLMQIWR